MRERPFFNKSIAELEATFERSRENAGTLYQLIHELGFRSTQRALALKQQVEAANKSHTNKIATRGHPPVKAKRSEPEQPEFPLGESQKPGEPVTNAIKSGPKPPVTNEPQNILRAWTALEVLSPQGYRRETDLVAGDRSRIAHFEDKALPWEAGEKSRPKKRLYYELILGSIELAPAVESLLKIYADKRPDKPSMRGHNPIASILLDKDGRPLEEDSELGQPLAHKDTAVTVLGRGDLVNILGPYFADPPNDDVVCVHGEEGCGKSWIVIQSWLAQSDKPLLVFATPDDFSDAATQDDIEALLIAKLVAQTGGVKSEESAIRWRRRLKAWKADDKPSRPRFVLVIDGINQRPGRVWGRIISNVATYLNRRGGRVIFTARTHYFNARVKRALTYAVKEVAVPKWSADERDSILREHRVPLNKFNPSVAEFLRNPRILSIALEVFGSDVTAFEELSVDRLLFEHIMAGVKED